MTEMQNTLDKELTKDGPFHLGFESLTVAEWKLVLASRKDDDLVELRYTTDDDGIWLAFVADEPE